MGEVYRAGLVLGMGPPRPPFAIGVQIATGAFSVHSCSSLFQEKRPWQHHWC